MEKGRKTTNRSFVISLAIHILLLIFLFVHEKTFDSKREKPEKMEVQWVEFKEQPEPLKEAQIVEQDDTTTKTTTNNTKNKQKKSWRKESLCGKVVYYLHVYIYRSIFRSLS